MIVPRAIGPPIALLVALTTISVGFYVGIGKAPADFFGSADDVVLGPASGEIPGRDKVDGRLAPALRSLPDVRAVSPEVFVLTTIDQRSAFVRGVEFEPFLALERASLVRGRVPATPWEALAGEDFARSDGVDVGEAVVVPGTLARVAHVVTIVGIFAAEGPSAEELLVSLEVARDLAGLTAPDVHLVRIDTFDRAALLTLLDSVAPTFTYGNVRIDPLDPVVGGPVVMSADLTNWGVVSGYKTVQVKQGDKLLAETLYNVPSRTTIPVRIEFSMPEPGEANVTINPTFQLVVRNQTLGIFPPGRAIQGQPFDVTVLDEAGNPAPGVFVTAADLTARTDDQGRATLRIDANGTTRLFAARGDKIEGVSSIFVADPNVAAFAILNVISISAPGEVIGVNNPVEFRVGVSNTGGATGSIPVNLTVDGVVNATTFVTLGPGQGTSVPFLVGPFAAGPHTIGVEGTDVVHAFKAYPGRDPRVAALLEALEERARSPPSDPVQEDAESYIDRLLGNVQTAVVALSIASGVLAATAGLAVLSRHIAERSQSLGVLKALGARDDQVLEIASRESGILAAIASIVGVGAGVGLARLLDSTGFVRAFGHSIHPHFPWYTLALLALLSVAFVVLATRLLVAAALKRSPDALMRGELLRPAEREPPELRTVLQERA